MPRSIHVILKDGESLESAVRRFKRKVRAEMSSLPSRGEANGTVRKTLAGKRTRRKLGSSGLFDLAIEQVGALPVRRQDAIAGRVLAELEAERNPDARRFQALVEAKYTRGLTAAEREEWLELDKRLSDAEASFYEPILERVKAAGLAAKSGRAGRR